ncbi:hypothetical protein CKAN_01772500 [Cinnamomum micranthum f. kanehirae]|uniref:Uncharacterized protein n=1 Tax=Cinnamomum micranthum f. kanehirae TaxID=337451 RepID=A0A443PD71_9MAGN|nr:hypothetical protein CKAN_01772500 [Cinnamomum micranthum f. kanehirae]
MSRKNVSALQVLDLSINRLTGEVQAKFRHHRSPPKGRLYEGGKLLDRILSRFILDFIVLEFFTPILPTLLNSGRARDIVEVGRRRVPRRRFEECDNGNRKHDISNTAAQATAIVGLVAIEEKR